MAVSFLLWMMSALVLPTVLMKVAWLHMMLQMVSLLMVLSQVVLMSHEGLECLAEGVWF